MSIDYIVIGGKKIKIDKNQPDIDFSYKNYQEVTVTLKDGKKITGNMLKKDIKELTGVENHD